MSKREALFKGKVTTWLKGLTGCWFFKTNELSLLGIPDIVGCLNGRFFALELKRDKVSKPSKMQLYMLSLIQKSSGYAVITYPENWERVQVDLISLKDGKGVTSL